MKELSSKQRGELFGALKPRVENPLDRQKLDVVNQTRSNPALRDWRDQFTPEFVGRFTAMPDSSIIPS